METKDEASPVEGVVMREESLRWRVRWETPGGMYTFTDVVKHGGFKLDRTEVEDWAETQVRAHPSKYTAVAAVINLDA